jgi:hypothetical protein
MGAAYVQGYGVTQSDLFLVKGLRVRPSSHAAWSRESSTARLYRPTGGQPSPHPWASARLSQEAQQRVNDNCANQAESEEPRERIGAKKLQHGDDSCNGSATGPALDV